MKHLFAVIITVALTFSAAGAKPADTPVEPLAELLAIVDPVETFQADFVQRTAIAGFGEDVYRGAVSVKTGEAALWDYAEPYRQYYLFTDTRIEHYDASTNQVMVQQVEDGASSGNVMLELLLDMRTIGMSFSVEKRDGAFFLRPFADMAVRSITISFSDGRLATITSIDPQGNRTTVEFSDQRINKSLPGGVFAPGYPEDAELFEY